MIRCCTKGLQWKALILHILMVRLQGFSLLSSPARDCSRMHFQQLFSSTPEATSGSSTKPQVGDGDSYSLQQEGDEQQEPTTITTTIGADEPTSAFRRTQTYCVKAVTRRAGPLNEAVAQILNSTASLEEANELIAIGAVWARMDALTEEEMLALYDEEDDKASSSRAMYADLQGIYNKNYDGSANDEDADLDRYLKQLETQRFKRVLSPSWMEAGTDVRIYPNPRRFTEACDSMTREHNLLYEDTTFVVVDKPPMLPTQADSSNYYECCPGCVQDKIGPFEDILGREISRPLLCHRVDSCVGGCVVLSKDRNGQKVFHDLQRQRKLRKMYLAVTTKPVPTGMHLHWMWSPQSARGNTGGPPCQLVSLTPPESRRKARMFWNRCTLEVVKCEPIEIDGDVDGHDYRPAVTATNDDGKQPQHKQQHYQSTIRLVTGRKHQVRAQLSALGCPIIRDTLYEPMAGLTLDSLDTDEELMDMAMAQTRVPTKPIGLQAHGILFAGVKARANTPWWGNRIMKDAVVVNQED
mmetsp:Transcript_15102/g.19741  ORF Transcript_15102/g.19741 Transcript_15102/m.19741 type:complete len:525 (+) Transcript_15102:109-1683(+)